MSFVLYEFEDELEFDDDDDAEDLEERSSFDLLPPLLLLLLLLLLLPMPLLALIVGNGMLKLLE